MLKIIFIGYILFCVCLSISAYYNMKDALIRNNITKETYPKLAVKNPLPKRIANNILICFIMLTPILNFAIYSVVSNDEEFMKYIDKLYK